MDPWLAGLVILGTAGLSAAGAHRAALRARIVFRDPIPAAAVYTVVGTANMVIVAFVFFVAFESYGGPPGQEAVNGYELVLVLDGVERLRGGTVGTG